MHDLELELTTHQALRLWTAREPVVIRADGEIVTMLVESVVDHPSGWSTVRFRRYQAVA